MAYLPEQQLCFLEYFFHQAHSVKHTVKSEHQSNKRFNMQQVLRKVLASMYHIGETIAKKASE